MDRAVFLSVLLFLAGLSSAGTVTLTGSCRPIINASATSFSLSNSGNDSAYNLVIIPFIQGARPAVASYSAGSLSPQSNDTFLVNFTNVTQKGNHAAYMSLAYQQGSSVFAAVFPCVVPLYAETVSQLLLESNATVASDGNATIEVRAFNAGSDTIDANISLALPAVFGYAGQDRYSLSIAPHQSSSVVFHTLFPVAGLQASYGAAAFATYSASNLSYASMSPFVVAFGSPSTASGGALILFGAVVAVVIVAALIALSMLKEKKTPPAHESKPQV